MVLLLFSHIPLPLLLLYIFAQLAHFRQRKTKGDCAHSQKKTAKRKGSTVDASVQEESPIATEDGGLLGAGMVCKSMSCSDTPDGASGAFAAQVDLLSYV
jgi:pericentrin